MVFLLWRWRRLVGKQLPFFAIYAVVLSITAACAIAGLSAHTLQGQMIALGGALFFLSDAMILGRTLFTATHAVDWVIMITYYSAQLLIAASCLV